MTITKNLANLREVRELIELHEENEDRTFDMGTWARLEVRDDDGDYRTDLESGQVLNLGTCGTSACAAGWAIHSVAPLSFRIEKAGVPIVHTLIGGTEAHKFFAKELSENLDFYKDYYATSDRVVDWNKGYWPSLDYQQVGARILGLTYAESEVLFYSGSRVKTQLDYIISVASHEESFADIRENHHRRNQGVFA